MKNAAPLLLKHKSDWSINQSTYWLTHWLTEWSMCTDTQTEKAIT